MATCRCDSERRAKGRAAVGTLALAAVLATACGGPGRPTEASPPPVTAPPFLPPTAACDAPVVSLDHGQRVSGRVLLSCDFPPDRCEETLHLHFYVQREEGTTPFPGTNANNLGTDSTHPYGVTWDTWNFADGPYLVGCCAVTVRRRVCSLGRVLVAN